MVLGPYYSTHSCRNKALLQVATSPLIMHPSDSTKTAYFNSSHYFYRLHSAVQMNNTLMICGGLSQDVPLTSCYMYNQQTDSWEAVGI